MNYFWWNHNKWWPLKRYVRTLSFSPRGRYWGRIWFVCVCAWTHAYVEHTWTGKAIRMPGLNSWSLFLFWRYVKNVVYAEKNRDINHLRKVLLSQLVTWHLLCCSMPEEKWNVVPTCNRVTNGSYIKVYWDKNKMEMNIIKGVYYQLSS